MNDERGRELERLHEHYEQRIGDLREEYRKIDEVRSRRRTVLARQSPVARRLHRWASGKQADTDVADDVRALLESYDYVLYELKSLRVQVAALTGEHSGACDEQAACQRCADRAELEYLRGVEKRARQTLGHHAGTSVTAAYIIGEEM